MSIKIGVLSPAQRNHVFRQFYATILKLM